MRTTATGWSSVSVWLICSSWPVLLARAADTASHEIVLANMSQCKPTTDKKSDTGGEDFESGGGLVTLPLGTTAPPAQADAVVAALEKLGVKIGRDGHGKIDFVDLTKTQVTDAGLVHRKGLTNLKWLELDGTHITDAGVAEVKKALPNCYIGR